MSHVTTGDTCITNLGDVEAALRDLGVGELVKGQTSFRWYGRWMDDWSVDEAAVSRGWDPKTFGQCEHVIRAPDIKVGNRTLKAYEVGLVRRPDGKGWDIMFDTYGLRGAELERVFGERLAGLKTAIGIASIRRVNPGKRIQVTKEKGRTRVRVFA